jgi:Tfp pilus assembly protein PilX
MTMTRLLRPSSRSAQNGATLFLTLIMLVVITIISLATLGTSLMELRMSNNAESSMSAQQAALSATDNVIQNAEANFTIAGSVGHTNCTPGLSCSENSIVLPAPFNTHTDIEIMRESETMCPLPLLHYSTSCTSSKAASFKVYSNRSGLGLGRSELYQGYISVFPLPPGSSDPPAGNSLALHN